MTLDIMIFQIIVLLFSVIIHEYSHAWAADQMGDPTARHAGRLTLNPIAHIDMWGTIIVPLFLVITNVGFIFGWAKPVPYNPYNLNDQKWGPLKVAIAGPLANLVVALFFGLILRFVGIDNPRLILAFSSIVYINILLMVFNLVPIPPLDGSKVLFALLPDSMEEFKINLERWGFVILLIFIFYFFRLISPIIYWVYRVIIGG